MGPPFVGVGETVTEPPEIILLALVTMLIAAAIGVDAIVRLPLKLAVVADFCPAIFPVMVIALVGTEASNTLLLQPVAAIS